MLVTFIENCQYIPVWLNSDKKDRYFTWRLIYIYEFSIINVIFAICGYHDQCSTNYMNYIEVTSVSIVAMITLAYPKCFFSKEIF